MHRLSLVFNTDVLLMWLINRAPGFYGEEDGLMLKMFFLNTQIFADAWEPGPPSVGLKNDKSLTPLKCTVLLSFKLNFTLFCYSIRINRILSCLHNRNTRWSMNGMLLLHFWECQIAVVGKKPMEQPSSLTCVGIADSDLLFIHKILLMSRVLKPFYNTAVSLFYSLTKIATNIFQCSIPFLQPY